MSWGWLSWLYTFCLTIGTAYTVVAFFLGHVGHGHDGGGHDAGGHDAGGHDHGQHFPLFSPIALAVFLTAFGAAGIVSLEMMKGREPLTLAVAGASGVVFGFTIAAAMALVFRKTIASSHARESDVLGCEAVVTITIPAGGVGKIAYEAAGSRFTSPARSMSGTEVRQDAKVVIRERDGQVLVVVAK